jgi:hypothetical protein
VTRDFRFEEADCGIDDRCAGYPRARVPRADLEAIAKGTVDLICGSP